MIFTAKTLLASSVRDQNRNKSNIFKKSNKLLFSEFSICVLIFVFDFMGTHLVEHLCSFSSRARSTENDAKPIY